MMLQYMSKAIHQKMRAEPLYKKIDGDIYVKFVKPVRLVRKLIYKKRSVVFQVPL